MTKLDERRLEDYITKHQGEKFTAKEIGAKIGMHSQTVAHLLRIKHCVYEKQTNGRIKIYTLGVARNDNLEECLV